MKVMTSPSGTGTEVKEEMDGDQSEKMEVVQKKEEAKEELNAKMETGHAFLIRDLDDTHLFVHTDYVPFIKGELEKFKKLNTYETVIE